MFPTEHKPEASGYITVCCCHKCSTQTVWEVCDDRWSQADNTSGTYLGDENDNSKQVCN